MRVTWEIDVFDCATPREAALKAFAAMKRADMNNPASATVFDVEGVEVDLSDPEEDHDD